MARCTCPYLRLRDRRLLLTFTVRDLKPPLGARAVPGLETEDGFEFDPARDRMLLDTRIAQDRGFSDENLMNEPAGSASRAGVNPRCYYEETPSGWRQVAPASRTGVDGARFAEHTIESSPQS